MDYVGINYFDDGMAKHYLLEVVNINVLRMGNLVKVKRVYLYP